jgi:hypothetical protein
VFVVGLLLWVASVVVTFVTANTNLVPTVILFGSFLVPITFATYAFDHADQVLTAQRILAAFVYGGVLGVLGASVLEAAFLTQPSMVCCIVPTRGVLKARHISGSDCDRELGEGDRHAAIHWLLGGQLVVPRRTFWTNAWPAMIALALRSRLRPRIGRSRAFKRPWSASTRLLAYCSVRCHAAGSSSSSTTG